MLHALIFCIYSRLPCIAGSDYGKNLKERTGEPMKLKVRLFLDGKPIDPSEYNKIIITCPAVDRIVNDIYDTSAKEPDPQHKT